MHAYESSPSGFEIKILFHPLSSKYLIYDQNLHHGTESNFQKTGWTGPKS